MALYARLNILWKWNAGGSKILSEKGWRSLSVADKIIAAQLTTQTSSRRSRADSSFLSEMHFPLGSADLEGQFSVCLRPPWTVVILFWFVLTQNLKIPFLYLGDLTVLFTLPDLLCDSNYLRGERRMLAIKKRQSAFLKYSLSGLIQDRNNSDSL